MGFIKAIFNRFRTAKIQITEKIADSYEDGKLAIQDQKVAVDKFVESIAKFTANNNKVKQDRDKELENISKYDKVAKAAVEQNNLEDAKDAIELKLASSSLAKNLSSEIERNEKIIIKLRKQLSSNKSKVREADRRLEMLKARQSGVDMRNRMVKTNSGLLSQNTGLASLEVFSDEVNTQELEVEAMEELTEEDNISLTEKYSTTNEDVQKELDKLLKKKKTPKKTAKKTTPKKK